jgi:hypothetical protein
MAHRSGWRRLVLVVMLMLVSLPAMAGVRPGGRRSEGRGFTVVWRAAVRWVVPADWLAKLGPEMDPDGLTSSTGPSGCSGGPAKCGELGPEMDPNG